MTPVEQALREALEWALRNGGWRLLYYGEQPLSSALSKSQGGVGPATINDAYLDSLREKP